MNPPLPPRPLSLILRSQESALYWLCSILSYKEPQKFSSKIIALIGNTGVINGYNRKILNTISYKDLVFEEEELKIIHGTKRRLLIIIIYSSMSILITINNSIIFQINILWLLLLFFRYYCLQNIYNEINNRLYKLYRHLCKKLEE